jgi:hypothetical protein
MAGWSGGQRRHNGATEQSARVKDELHLLLSPTAKLLSSPSTTTGRHCLCRGMPSSKTTVASSWPKNSRCSELGPHLAANNSSAPWPPLEARLRGQPTWTPWPHLETCFHGQPKRLVAVAHPAGNPFTASKRMERERRRSRRGGSQGSSFSWPTQTPCYTGSPCGKFCPRPRSDRRGRGGRGRNGGSWGADGDGDLRGHKDAGIGPLVRDSVVRSRHAPFSPVVLVTLLFYTLNTINVSRVNSIHIKLYSVQATIMIFFFFI